MHVEAVGNAVRAGGTAAPAAAEPVEYKTKFVSPLIVGAWSIGGRVPASRLRSCVSRTSIPALSTCVLLAGYVAFVLYRPTCGGSNAANPSSRVDAGTSCVRRRQTHSEARTSDQPR